VWDAVSAGFTYFYYGTSETNNKEKPGKMDDSEKKLEGLPKN